MNDPNLHALERATLAAWPPRVHARMHGWVLNASSGTSGRINSIWPLAWTGEVSLDTAIDDAAAWMRAQGLTPSFKISEALVQPAALLPALHSRGYRQTTPTFVMARDLAPTTPDLSVRITATPDDIFLAPMRADAPPADYEERRDALMRAPSPRACAAIMEGDEALAAGACVIVDKIASIFVMRTMAHAQRRGLARRILSALQAWAHENGATIACLQVEAPNAPAIALYRAAGFAAVYDYHQFRAAD